MLKQERKAREDEDFDGADSFLSTSYELPDPSENYPKREAVDELLEDPESSENEYDPLETCNLISMSTESTLTENENIVISKPTESDIKCEVCEETFSCWQDFNTHSGLMNHGKKKMFCEKCPDAYFERNSDLVSHNRNRHYESKECEVCKKLCTSYHQYQWHNTKHFGKVHNCTLCSKTFLKKSKLEDHMNVHTGETPYRCEICNLGFCYKRSYTSHNTRKHLMVDEEIQEKKLDYQCTFCDKGFSNQRYLAAHVRCFHTKTAKNKCTDCNLCFLNFQKLETHLISVHGHKSPYQCTKCDRKPFSSKGDLTKHHKSRHGQNQESYSSQTDTQSRSSNENDVQDEENESLEKFSPSQENTTTENNSTAPDSHFNIEECDSPQQEDHNFVPRITETDMKILVEDFKFKPEPEVSENEEIVSSPQISSPDKPESTQVNTSQLQLNSDPKRKYKCQFCGMGFRTRYRVTEHERSHTGEKPFQCTVCNKRFSTKRNIKDHELIHTNNYVIFCNICGKGVRDQAALRHHVKVHSDTKPFQCHICHKRFTAAYTVTQHLLLHSGEKPFQCDICKKTFTTKSAMSKHHRRNHENKKEFAFACTLCGETFSKRIQFNKHNILVHEKKNK